MQILLANRKRDLSPRGRAAITQRWLSGRSPQMKRKHFHLEREIKLSAQWLHSDLSRIQSISWLGYSLLQLPAPTKDPTNALCPSRCLKQHQGTSSESCATDTQTSSSFLHYKATSLTWLESAQTLTAVIRNLTFKEPRDSEPAVCWTSAQALMRSCIPLVNLITYLN